MTKGGEINTMLGMRDAVRTGRRVAGRLRLPDPWRVEDLCAQVAISRRRTIHVLDRPAHGDSITATVLSTATADYIFCRADLKGIHRDHAICHELGHLLAGHTQHMDLATDLTAAPRAVETMMLDHACSHDQKREQEAEAIADVIMERVSQRMDGHQDDQHRQRVIRGFGDALR